MTQPKVLLVGNYLPDKQESMLRFASMLKERLPSKGFQTILIQPHVYLLSLVSSNNRLRKWLGYIDKYILFPRKLRNTINKTQPDLVHICDHSNAPYIQACKQMPHLLTCNDLIAIRSAREEIPSHRTKWTGKQLQSYILGNIKKSKYFACISNKTKDDLTRIAKIDPMKARTIYMGQNYPYSPLARDYAKETVSRLLAKPNFKTSYIIHVGHNGFYKNKPGVLELYKALKANSRTPLDLIFVGPPLPLNLSTWINKNHLETNIHILEDVSNKDLQALYSGAELLLFPSLLEGFGWPIIEAQACGCPVVTTRDAPMTELGSDAAFYVPSPNNDSLASWANGCLPILQKALNTPPERISDGIKNAGRFTAKDMVSQYAEYYRKILEES